MPTTRFNPAFDRARRRFPPLFLADDPLGTRFPPPADPYGGISAVQSAPPGTEYESTGNYYVPPHQELDIPVTVPGLGVVTMHLALWKPRVTGNAAPYANDPDHKAPILIDASIYTTHPPTQRYLAYQPIYHVIINEALRQGYGIGFLDPLGHGGSGGAYDYNGPLESAAYAAVIEWIADPANRATGQPLAWASGAVGLFGHSYSAATACQMASRNPTGLRAVFANVPPVDRHRTDVTNGVPRPLRASAGAYQDITLRAMLTTAVAPDSELTDAEVLARFTALTTRFMAAVPTAQAAFNTGTNSISGDKTEYWEERAETDRAAQVATPVFVVGHLRDEVVFPEIFADWYEGIPGTKHLVLTQSTAALLLGASTHAQQMTNAYGRGTGGGASNDRTDWREQMFAWFNYFCWDAPVLGPATHPDNGYAVTQVPDWPAVQVHDERGRVRAAPSIEGMGTMATFQLGRGVLVPQGRAVAAGSHGFGEVAGGMWLSPPFAADTHISGRMRVTLSISLDQPAAHFILDVDAVGPDGVKRGDARDLDYSLGAQAGRRGLSIVRGALSARHFGPGRSEGVPANVPTGQAFTYTFRYPLLDRWVKKGDRLRLILSGTDAAHPHPQMGVVMLGAAQTHPYAAAGTGYAATVLSGTLEVPIVGTHDTLLVRVPTSVHASGWSQADVGAPE